MTSSAFPALRAWASTAAAMALAIVLVACGGGALFGSGDSGGSGNGGGSGPDPVQPPVSVPSAVLPTIIMQPADASVEVGASATFVVAVSGGTAPVTFQWKRDGAPIAGATTTSYTVAAAALGDSGARFAVDIVNPAGTLRSATALLTVTATSTGKTWGAATRINAGDETTDSQPRYPQVVMDAAGNAISVWQEIDAGKTRNAVFASRYTAGGSWSTAANIDNAVGNAVKPKIAITPSGVAVAAFTQSSSNNGGNDDMQTNRFNGSWGTPQRIDKDKNDLGAFDPHVGLAPDGTATVVFTQAQGDPFARAWASRSTVTGTWADPQIVDAAGAIRPQVAVAANGHAVMTWAQVTGVSSNTLWASRNLGTGWATPVQIAPETGTLESPIRVVMDANGNAMAVWSQSLAGRNTLRSTRMNATSGAWDTPVTLNNISLDAINPQLAIDASGNVMAVWSEADLKSGSAVGASVKASRFNASSLTWGGAVAVQPNAGLSGIAPSVGVDANGNAIAVWQQAIPGNGSRAEVWGAQFNATSAAWAAPFKLMTRTGAYMQPTENEPQVAVNARGEAVVVWFERTDAPATQGIWARVYR